MKTKKDKAREEIRKATFYYLSHGGKITKIDIKDFSKEVMKFTGEFYQGHDCINNPSNWVGR